MKTQNWQLVFQVQYAQIPSQQGDFSGEILKASKDAEGVWRRLFSAWTVLSGIKFYLKIGKDRQYLREK